jgi:4-hydroxymandelate oxidase
MWPRLPGSQVCEEPDVGERLVAPGAPHRPAIAGVCYRLSVEILNLHELEQLAQARLPKMYWDYYASGADDESCLRRNREAFERVALHPRVLVDVSRRELATSVLGQPIALPVGVAPMAFHRLAHTDGELASVRAAGGAGTVFVLSTLSTTAVEDVVAAASGPVWFQLYVHRDRAATKALVQRVEAVGCRALVVTVDTPMSGRRERDVRNGFALPPGLEMVNVHASGHTQLAPVQGDSALASYAASMLDPGLTWDTVGWLRSITSLPVVLKGIVRVDDAVRAVEHGAAGIMVSNHGGRQLDAAPATLDVLPRIADAVAGRLEVFLDGGVRRGTDVLKALALGARAVFIGRPILWGLAAGGHEGASAVLRVVRREIDLAMALCGCPTVASVTRDLVAP